MSIPAKRIAIKLPSGERISVQDLPKNRIKKALLERVLPVQVPDAEIMAVCDRHGSPLRLDKAAFQRLSLPLTDLSVLPDVVAFSKGSKTLFLIETVHGFGSIDRYRFAELCVWTRDVPCRTVFVSVFASREAYARQFSSTVAESHIWFVDEPTHSISTSRTPAEALAVLERRRA